MKILFKISFVLFLFQPLVLQGNFSDDPGAVGISAKHAKLRAKLRAQSASDKIDAETSEASSDNNQAGVEQQLNFNDSDGCDLNVGNVLIDDTVRNAPDEVIVIIEGDIIQSNNCR